MSDDIGFRLRAAAKILERAASRASDPKLRSELEGIARRLRSMSTGAEEKSFEELVEEIRAKIREEHRVDRETKIDFLELLLLGPILKLDESLSKLDKLDELLRKLEEVFPI